MEVNEAKRLKQLEVENRELKQMVADLSLDNRALKELLGKNGEARDPPNRGGVVAQALRDERATSLPARGLHRSTCRYPAKPIDDDKLVKRLKELAAKRPRFGYRRLLVLLQREGWHVNH